MARNKKCEHENLETWDICNACGSATGKCTDCGAEYFEDDKGKLIFDE